MSDTIKLNKEGVAKIDSLLQKLIEDIGDDVYIKAKEIVPVKTGALRDSIYLEKKQGEAVIGEHTHYGIYVEFKKPYLRPALDMAIMDADKHVK